MSFYKSIPTTFVVGQTETSAIQMNEAVLTGLVVTGSKISGSLVSFLVSSDGVNFFPLFDDTNTEIVVTVTSSARSYALDPINFAPWLYVKARLGTSGSAKAQAVADQAIILIAK